MKTGSFCNGFPVEREELYVSVPLLGVQLGNTMACFCLWECNVRRSNNKQIEHFDLDSRDFKMPPMGKEKIVVHLVNEKKQGMIYVKDWVVLA